jgi:hypothetical protein
MVVDETEKWDKFVGAEDNALRLAALLQPDQAAASSRLIR